MYILTYDGGKPITNVGENTFFWTEEEIVERVQQMVRTMGAKVEKYAVYELTRRTLVPIVTTTLEIK